MRQTHSLPQFLLASICVHAGLLLPLTFRFDLATPAEVVLSIDLESVHEQAAIATNPEGKPTISIARNENETPLQTQHSSLVFAGPIREEPPAPPASSPPQDAAQTKSARAQVETRLLADLQRYFEYPAVARRHGWQGTVWLAFTIDAGGALDGIHVAQSSGYDVLDRSAIQAMQRVEPLPEARHWLNGQALDMRLPVIYRLVD